MKTFYKVIRIEFELENRDPITRKLVGYFSSFRKAEKALMRDQQKHKKTYSGYDGNVYPKWSLKEIEVK